MKRQQKWALILLSASMFYPAAMDAKMSCLRLARGYVKEGAGIGLFLLGACGVAVGVGGTKDNLEKPISSLRMALKEQVQNKAENDAARDTFFALLPTLRVLCGITGAGAMSYGSWLIYSGNTDVHAGWGDEQKPDAQNALVVVQNSKEQSTTLAPEIKK